MEERGDDERDQGKDNATDASVQSHLKIDEGDELFWKNNSEIERALKLSLTLLGTSDQITPLRCLFLIKRALNIPHLDVQTLKRKLDTMDLPQFATNSPTSLSPFDERDRHLFHLRLRMLGLDDERDPALLSKDQEKKSIQNSQKPNENKISSASSSASSSTSSLPSSDGYSSSSSLEKIQEKAKELETFLNELNVSHHQVEKIHWEAFQLDSKSKQVLKDNSSSNKTSELDGIAREMERLSSEFNDFNSKLKKDLNHFINSSDQSKGKNANEVPSPQQINWTAREDDSDRKRRKHEEQDHDHLPKHTQPWNLAKQFYDYRNIERSPLGSRSEESPSKLNVSEKESPIRRSHENLPPASMLMRAEPHHQYGYPFSHTVQTTTTRSSIMDNIRLLPSPIAGAFNSNVPSSPYPSYSPPGIYPSLYAHFPPPVTAPIQVSPNVIGASEWNATVEEIRDDKTQEKKLRNSNSGLGRDMLPGPPGGGGFYIRVQPNPNQRKCYPQEKRYIMPNPIVVSWKSGMFRGKGMVKVSLVNQNGEQTRRMQEKGVLLCFPDNELERVIRPDGIAEFCLKVTINCLSDEKFRLMFLARYELDDEPMIVHTQQLYSDPFEVQNNKSYNYKKSRKDQS
eukprot:TRINITY_DN2904_c0_g1_i1.p1 TRINITY_DN2904_c0_g1~~TRINITY_DN2904_c0_g1_i1.p1  ORF type:complete len:626 (+),score=200.44 TRINITY_DN2904_c0_g1_i1:207-2084(+)